MSLCVKETSLMMEFNLVPTQSIKLIFLHIECFRKSIKITRITVYVVVSYYCHISCKL